MSPSEANRARFANSIYRLNSVRGQPKLHTQQGAALLIFLAVLILVAAALLLDKLNAAVAPSPARDPVSIDSLARAKDALIAWSATHPNTPGLLPFPDRNDDDLLATADAPARYDGNSDCDVAGAIASTHLLGRFPFAGEQVGCTTGANVAMSVDVGDSSGAGLWYAVSQNLVLGGNGGPINPDIAEVATQPWITVRDQTGALISNRVAAVIIAPGTALAAQNRSAVAPGAANYLDSLTVGANTWNNADADGCPDVGGCGTPLEEFIVNPNPQPGDNFNDRLVYITIDELMRAVEDRVLGEAANALRTYRGNNPGNNYPWMSAFSDPRSPQGIATGGSATSLVDGTANFVATVSDFDLVRNLTDGSIGRVAAAGVTATTLTLEGLVGGTGNAFAAGDRYVIHAPTMFEGNAGTLEGMLPVHYPNELFRTGFTINWNFDNETQNVGGDPSLQPSDQTPEEWDNLALTVTYPNGLCMWTQEDRVDCKATMTFPGAGLLGSDRTVELVFNFTADTTNVIGSTATTSRTRNHTFNDQDYESPIGPVPLLVPAGQTWSVRVIDNQPLVPGTCVPLGTATNCGWRTSEPDGDSNLEITQFDGIRYEIVVPNELPAWFVDNNWHHFIHGVVSGANVPAVAGISSGDGTCTTPPTGAGNEPDDCLTIQYNATTVRDDVDALVLSPGAVLAAQNRNAFTACAPQPDFLCDYFETPNSDIEATTRNLIYGRAPTNSFEVSTTFNDQIRVVPP